MKDTLLYSKTGPKIRMTMNAIMVCRVSLVTYLWKAMRPKPIKTKKPSDYIDHHDPVTRLLVLCADHDLPCCQKDQAIEFNEGWMYRFPDVKVDVFRDLNTTKMGPTTLAIVVS
jgi:hypothetical protein